MKFLVMGLVASVLVITGSAAYKRYDAKGGDALAGKDKYIANCLVCHGDKGKGDGVAAATLPQQPSNLVSELSGPFSIFSYDSVLISRIIMKGKLDAGMPAFEGVLSKQDSKDIFAYIRSINP